jgi:rSAM/selenodomain-associated transferase 2
VLFVNREYSHGSVFEELVRTADEEGLSYGLAAIHQDMDTPEDIENFRSCMREDASLRKSHTGRFVRDRMSISLVLPVYNEITTIDRMISQLERIRGDFEIIIADGGSTDGTCNRIPEGFRVIHTGKGRAVQMNAGVAASHGDILFFVHCDSELPEDPAGEIRRVMAKYEAGCFGVAFHSKQFFMLTNRVISNLRAGVHRIMFGDQGIFMTRELFDRIGGFPEIPIMEDYQLSLTLREMGVRTGMARHRIYTSDRRYPKQTVPMLRLMAKMYTLRRDYKAGRSPEDIAREYRDIR